MSRLRHPVFFYGPFVSEMRLCATSIRNILEALGASNLFFLIQKLYSEKPGVKSRPKHYVLPFSGAGEGPVLARNADIGDSR